MKSRQIEQKQNNPVRISPAALAKQSLPGEEQRAWRSLWIEGKTFWDLGGVHPFVPDLLKEMHKTVGFRVNEARIFVPGCGRGHEAAYLALQGAIVDAVDYSPEAIEKAQQLYGKINGISFGIQNIFEQPASARETYDAIIDRALLCAIEPTDRTRYIQACVHRLKVGGLFLSIAFYQVRLPSGPPYAISETELTELTSQYFETVRLKIAEATTMTAYICKELVIGLRKLAPNEINSTVRDVGPKSLL